jgi:hypothetical protein
MKPSPEDLDYRAASTSDASVVLELIVQCETNEYGEHDSSL